jgi:hypothetical protein
MYLCVLNFTTCFELDITVRYNPPITVNSMTDLSQERDGRGTSTKVRKTKVILFQAEGK